ncbi:OadG family transporter subunit [uncultured Imperialibacter sp.]|uniref:OadG family transporter subunit n=1 Tax=uncultured Imperialibacter sp. TaxID=1672639 RepID=UPI0030D7A0E8|tara:strand:- start:113 stop:373 length:261 start_codon:yes stop_codon:yes gene_type:complete
MEDIERAVSLMGVGMITVFLVLALVVLTGNALIKFVNTFVPETLQASPKSPSTPTSQVASKKVAAITSAVHQLSGGKANIQKIEKL